ncbi:unnamed protein product [Symbiodinium pilosum]|uniref:RanBP2-type domain-containing protein n=1 Tax=Symbiodinium pilosum TaxID=2952 RepID=A0A812U850_SYMPI|nr:unnamed protein product [Symbiodinium pilosum]
MGRTKHQVTADGRCKRERKKGAVRAEVVETWKCRKCNFANDASLPFCEMCDEPRRDGEDPESEDEDLAEWSCSSCSFKNIGLLPYCEVCEAPRGSSSNAAGSAEEAGRECPLCSFRNASHRTACEMCSTPMPPRETPASGSSASRPPEPPEPEEEAPAPCTDEERRLLMSMGWTPENGDDEDGGLEDWEIHAAEEKFVRNLQTKPDREGLRERAQREFEAWKSQ